MSKGWAITLLVLVVVVFVGGSTVAALSFVTSINARPLTVTCTVASTYGDAAEPAADGERQREQADPPDRPAQVRGESEAHSAEHNAARARERGPGGGGGHS